MLKDAKDTELEKYLLYENQRSEVSERAAPEFLKPLEDRKDRTETRGSATVTRMIMRE